MIENNTQYKETMGLADDTAMVHVYAPEDDAETWKDEAKEHGHSSRSKYLYALIQEARAIRQSDVQGPRQAEKRIEELQAQIERLEQQLEQEQKAGSGSVDIDDPTFVKTFLTENYQPLTQIIQEIVESGSLNDLVRKPVEDQLYFLASQDEVQYERGWGWKLADGGDA